MQSRAPPPLPLSAEHHDRRRTLTGNASRAQTISRNCKVEFGKKATVGKRKTSRNLMQPLCYFAFTALCTLSFLSTVLSIQCNKTQYAWPVETSHLCCNMCPPGERMVRRSPHTCGIMCEACEGNRYIDTYNVEMSCTVCENCNKPNMEYESKCDTTHQAVCRCKAGFKCKDQPCTQCVPIVITTTTALKPVTLTTLWVPRKPLRVSLTDTVWFLVIIALLCAGFALIVVTKIKPFLRWIRAKHGYFLAKKPAPVPPCCQDDEVSTPVQEVCGKCDQPIDV
ncbi:uncharacterized protein cd27 isoform X3 [Siniperca chuatsi]|uniref:uncharacterized protein cd27 isoform X3 n=1 Tax=Siniperca chuatsi TaxID=119488 RepID=UPI001CE1B898|nr:uncharacterized protein cd27 isoform X3 [Siniperca chuatsi]XP_044065027.1 uncharacterized protein cd27 isoform X3 [Siniperca chuatsi]